MEHILNFFLLLTKEYFLVPFILFNIHFNNRKAFLEALIILLFSLILNVYLKSLWQIPLAPHIQSDSFAFPSGHMQSAMVFWGYLTLYYRNTSLYFLVSIILIAIAVALVFFGWHEPIDVLGGIFFGGLLLSIYFLLQKYLIHSSYIISILIFTSLICIYFLPKSFPHTWIALGSLCGIQCGNYLYTIKSFPSSTKQKIINFTLATLTILSIYYCFSKVTISDIRIKNFLQSLLAGIILNSFLTNYSKKLNV